MTHENVGCTFENIMDALQKKLSDNQVQIKNILAVCLRWFLVLNYRIDIMNPLDLKKFSFI